MFILLISDLHLDPTRPRITQLFLDFLQTTAPAAEALYILGDLFEAWVGDDDPDPHHARVISGLRQLSDRGVPVYFMHGNRDFLIGKDFAAQSGCRQLADPMVVDFYGTQTLLMHGDTLCTDDVEYQEFRRMVRDPAWQKAFLSKPLQERRMFANQARAESRLRTRVKAEYIMDVNQQTVEAVMQKHGVTRLIHGHTHRPAVHTFQSGGAQRTRVVLGDWYEQGSLLQLDKNQFNLKALPIP